MLMEFLEASIKKRIEELNDTVEDSPDITKLVEDTEVKFDELKKVVSGENLQLLLDIFYNYGCQIIDAQDVYYRKGFVDGMQLQQEISTFSKGERG